MLFLGVGLGFLAVVAIAAADFYKRASQDASPSTEGATTVETKPLIGSGAQRASVNSHSTSSSQSTSTSTSSSHCEEDVEEMAAGTGGVPGAEEKAVGPLVAATVCLVAGVLMSGWGPLSAYAQDDTAVGALNPYSTFLLYCIAVLMTTLKPSPLAIFLVWSGTLSEGVATTPAAYYKLTVREHGFGWVGG
eukprot:SAG31_NODE_10600_length_1118_cov_4.169774_2_plen_191_part_00